MLFEDFEDEVADPAKPLKLEQHYARQAELVCGARIRNMIWAERVYQRSKKAKFVLHVIFAITSILSGIFLFNLLYGLYSGSIIFALLTSLFFASTIATMMLRNAALHVPTQKAVVKVASEKRKDLAYVWIKSRYGFTVQQTNETYNVLFQNNLHNLSPESVVQNSENQLIKSVYVADNGFILFSYINNQECPILEKTQK